MSGAGVVKRRRLCRRRGRTEDEVVHETRFFLENRGEATRDLVSGDGGLSSGLGERLTGLTPSSCGDSFRS
jgi:hypothetical protein